MVADFPTQKGSSGGATVEAYQIALRGVSLAAVLQTLEAVIAGRQLGFDGVWRPTSAQLGEWCRQRDALMKRAAAPIEEGKIVSYRIGEQPPDGYVALGEWEDRKNREAELRRDAIEAKYQPRLQTMGDDK